MGALSLETTSPGVGGGLAEQGMPGDWKEWIDGELDPWIAPLGFDIQEGPQKSWEAGLGTLRQIFRQIIVWHALSGQHPEQFGFHRWGERSLQT